MGNLIPAMLMVAGFGLLFGAWAMRKRGAEPRKLFLMVLAALVMFANVAIWTIPTKSGESLSEGLSGSDLSGGK